MQINVINLFKKYRALVAIATVLALVIYVWVLDTKQIQPPTTPAPYTQTTDQKIPQQDTKPLKLMGISPNQGTWTSSNTFQEIRFMFNDTIELKTVSVKAGPFVKLVTKLDETKTVLRIFPEIEYFWNPQTNYTVTVSGNIESQYGTKLGTDIIYKFRIEPPESIMVGEGR